MGFSLLLTAHLYLNLKMSVLLREFGRHSLNDENIKRSCKVICLVFLFQPTNINYTNISKIKL